MIWMQTNDVKSQIIESAFEVAEKIIPVTKQIFILTLPSFCEDTLLVRASKFIRVNASII